MTLSVEAAQKALVAFNRFGLGAKPGGPANIGHNPLAALIWELNTPNIAKIDDDRLPWYGKACHDAEVGFGRAEDNRRLEMDARIDKHRRVPIGFVERLVIFWTNHFSMSVNKADVIRGTLGQLERDVIRKHVLGRFQDMVLGVMQHPAMIAFLDNQDSIGPNSPIGRSWGAGFNENLAREAMELHTVGSGGGYTEDDVTAFAKILTGWSYVRGWESDGHWNGGTAANRGMFIYRWSWHEPGPITFMGKRYRATGQAQAKEALTDLALNPATAEHIAFKLVRHFIVDEPTPEMVNPIKNEYIRTRGNLKAVALKLLNLEAAWSTPLQKIRTPYEIAIAQFRALGVRYRRNEFWALSETLRALNQMIWECPSPEGYPDDTFRWLDPDGMTIRIDTALLSSWMYENRVPFAPSVVANNIFDRALSRASRTRIVGAGDRNAQFTMLFSTPEFQRR